MANRNVFSGFSPMMGMNLAWQLTRTTIDAQAVVAMRLTKIARGDAAAQTETALMFQEKIQAMGESQMIAMKSIGTADGGAQRIARLYGRRVAANRKRLSRT